MVWWQVLAFFAKLGMPLPERPPLLLVDSESLGNAREKEGDCSHVQPPGSSPAPTSGPVLHTRGLCLWQVSLVAWPMPLYHVAQREEQ